jgi:hypothetical protein
MDQIMYPDTGTDARRSAMETLPLEARLKREAA